MTVSYLQTATKRRYEAATAIGDGCGEAIRVCAGMMEAAETIGAYSELCDIREAILRLHGAALTVLEQADRAKT